jgi:hypothetical protein
VIIPFVFPICLDCKHLAPRGDREPGDMRCAAFPGDGGIPDEILLMDHDHREPYPGDHGIRFEPIERAAPPKSS